ncbi:hypothetical protein [Nocardioides pacificus]
MLGDLRARVGGRRRAHADAVRATIAREIIEASDLFDQEWVEAQLATRFESRSDAIDAYLHARPACSPHPLFEPEWLDQRGHDRDQAYDALSWYVDSREVRNRRLTHPLVDLDAIVEQLPDARKHRYGPLALWASLAGDDTLVPTPRDVPPVTWGRLREQSLRSAREWRKLNRVVDAPRLTSRAPQEADLATPAPPRHGPGSAGLGDPPDLEPRGHPAHGRGVGPGPVVRAVGAHRRR